MNCVCEICGRRFHRKQYQIDKNKHHYCSKECANIAARIRMSGENNHQYGLRGELNASWRGGRHTTSYGYILVHCPEHPFANGDGNVFEHRLVAEKYLLTPEASVEINGKKYLSPDYVVHHIDFDHKNNDVSNLVIMEKGQHISYHNSLTKRERNELGQFI